ncbi:MAG: hypothetical protein NXI18_13495 [Alphaproteobacteria bacterium]|nr:hypothetical protein [Alphaproteobacteria bacterium]
MTRRSKTKTDTEKRPPTELQLQTADGESGDAALARAMLEPYVRHGLIAGTFAGRSMASTEDKPRLMESAAFIDAQATAAAGADMSLLSQMLTAQTITLDSIFTELCRCAVLNLSDYPHAADRYTRLALKAQSNCRATMEALAKLHQPREQTVRHVHVGDGGKAIVAEQFHQHARGGRNEESAEQSHATASTGSGAKMLGHDAGGHALPIPSGERTETVPNARRHKSRRSKG